MTAAVLLAARPATARSLADVTRDVLTEITDLAPRLHVDAWHVYTGWPGMAAVMSIYVAGSSGVAAAAALALADGTPVEYTATTSQDGEVHVSTWATTYAGVRVAITIVDQERRTADRGVTR